jgi:Taurine catabolism dioxygenase TauD, TfdA family
VRTHPETGRKALYINIGHTVRFKDMTEAESAPLLNFLFEHQTKPEFTCRFNWQLARWRSGTIGARCTIRSTTITGSAA